MKAECKKHRILWIDYIKGMCMIAVILNHLYGPVIYGRLTYPFELAGFFFTAGYTFDLTDSFFNFMRKKIRSLAIPIVFFGLIDAVLSYYAKGGLLLPRIKGIFLQMPGDWDVLWFVACLFTMELMFYPIARFVSSLTTCFMFCIGLSVWGYVFMTVSPIILPWHIENACVMIVFLCLGYVFRKSKVENEILAELKTTKGWLIGMIMLASYISFVTVNENYPIDIHLHQYGLFVVFMVSALLGLVVIFCLSLFLERWSNVLVVRFLWYIGANTLVYYAFQSKVIAFLNILGDKVGLVSFTHIGCVVYCISTCIILMVPSYFIKRYTPFMLGRF
ncbi:acyltransferase family protein [Phocaeicola vulgatus]